MIKKFYLSEIIDVLQGKMWGYNVEITGISIDSRTIRKGDLFVAIKGDYYDGHQFIQSAFENGASACLVHKLDSFLKNKSYIHVLDTFIALGQLASNQSKYADIPFIGVTGSCGKTSIKEMLYGILKIQYPTLATKGNLNNGYGVPLTVFSLEKEHQYAVIELGTNAPGEIDYLAKIIKPTIAIISNAGESHTKLLGDKKGVAKEKGAILDSIVSNGYAILNMDDPFFEYWRLRAIDNPSGIYISTFSLKNKKANCFTTNIKQTSKGMQFNLNIDFTSIKVLLPLWGEHQVLNACCAALTAKHLGVDIEIILRYLEQVKPFLNRGEHIALDDNVKIIDESYNANPTSVKASLETLSKFNGYKIFVFSDMLELGQIEVDRHIQIGQFALTKKIDHILTYGQLSKFTSKVFIKNKNHFDTKNELLLFLTKLIEQLNHSKITILIKGSNSMGMSEISKSLKKLWNNRGL